MARRKDESLFALLLKSPWPVSAIAGLGVYVALKWVLPALGAHNIFLKAIAAGLTEVAGLLSLPFFLISGFVLLKQSGTPSARPKPVSSETPKAAPTKPWGSHRWGSPSPVDTAWGETISKPDTPAAPSGKPTEWSIELIRALEWKRFEDVCQQFYENKGIRSATTPLGPDGGIDIRLYQDESNKATSIVQCKAWGRRYVGVKEVRELLGVMTHEKIGKAFFMTSGYYSEDAKSVAKANGITLIDGDMLLMMFQRLPANTRDSLLAFATEGDYTTPTCPSCGTKMKRHPGKTGKRDFWGCPNYRKCRQRILPCRK